MYIAMMKALAQEVVEKFSTKVKPLGIKVKELTGDMQISRTEAEVAYILVTTQEKWDGMALKGGGRISRRDVRADHHRRGAPAGG